MLYTVYNLEQEHLNLLATFWVGHENKALFFVLHHKLTENGSGD